MIQPECSKRLDIKNIYAQLRTLQQIIQMDDCDHQNCVKYLESMLIFLKHNPGKNGLVFISEEAKYLFQIDVSTTITKFFYKRIIAKYERLEHMFSTNELINSIDYKSLPGMVQNLSAIENYITLLSSVTEDYITLHPLLHESLPWVQMYSNQNVIRWQDLLDGTYGAVVELLSVITAINQAISQELTTTHGQQDAMIVDQKYLEYSEFDLLCATLRQLLTTLRVYIIY